MFPCSLHPEQGTGLGLWLPGLWAFSSSQRTRGTYSEDKPFSGRKARFCERITKGLSLVIHEGFPNAVTPENCRGEGVKQAEGWRDKTEQRLHGALAEQKGKESGAEFVCQGAWSMQNYSSGLCWDFRGRLMGS